MAEPRDVPRVVAYFRDQQAFLAPFSPRRPPGFITEAYWHERIAQSLDDFNADRAMRLFLFDRAAGNVLGTCSFTQIERGPAQYCVLGFGLSEGHQGRGLMAEALR
ncbi:MAG TPA: GNAT family N-acetyltransferase, partial [Phycisphaerae bacterium]|nr:GNAT family N-acetyltransferase [Phycisphaerae bacterium]